MSTRSLRSLIVGLTPGTARWVIEHAKLATRKQKNLSATFLGFTNPRKALEAAQKAIELESAEINLTEDSASALLTEFLKQEREFRAFFDPKPARVVVDGWYPAKAKTRNTFSWKTFEGQAMKFGDPNESASMRLFRERLLAFVAS